MIHSLRDDSRPPTPENRWQVNESEFWRSVIIPTRSTLLEYTVSLVIVPSAALFLLSVIR